MQFIDEKFKDSKPETTVEKIRGILDNLGIVVKENGIDSGIDYCHSLSVSANNGVPSANGKGVSAAFARASAYGEFIERLQNGLYQYKYQSIQRNPGVNLNEYAPDGKYMTEEELIENGQWMDYLVDAYPELQLTRQTIAEYCRIFACADDGRILTHPYYSLFEKKYVYIPLGFVEQMYTTNGLCAGNSREEAWVHAMSEIMERNANIRILSSGQAAPRLPEEMLEQFSTVKKILDRIRETGEYEVEVYDYSVGNGMPVIATLLIDKVRHNYLVNVSADPVFEIAVERTLTELFQGKNIYNFAVRNNSRIMGSVDEMPLINNIMNQLESGDGAYTADYFSGELTCKRECSEYGEHSHMSNYELMKYMVDMFRNMGKQIYVRNFSYLGFPSYRILIPGFSETRALRLAEPFPDYALADSVCGTFRNPLAASDEDLLWMLQYSDSIRDIYSRYNYFGRIAGVPLAGRIQTLLAHTTRAYGAYRLKRYSDVRNYLNICVSSGVCSESDKDYFSCINRYLELKQKEIAEEKIRIVLYKFYKKESPDRLYAYLDQGKTPLDGYLLSCTYTNCQSCKYADSCSYQAILEMNRKIGAVYKTFVNGQNPNEFAID